MSATADAYKARLEASEARTKSLEQDRSADFETAMLKVEEEQQR